MFDFNFINSTQVMSDIILSVWVLKTAKLVGIIMTINHVDLQHFSELEPQRFSKLSQKTFFLWTYSIEIKELFLKNKY